MHRTIFVAPIICGCVALIVSVLPGLLDSFIEGIISFRLSPWFPSPRVYRRNHVSNTKDHYWFAGIGFIFIVLGVFAWISS